MKDPFREPYKIETGTSKFGAKRDYGLHSGQDRNGVNGGNTDCGYKLYPLTDGELVHASEASTGYGNIVVYKIEGRWGDRWIRYCHCSKIVVRSGLVSPDTVIAELGTTGNSSACHLHWDVITKPLRNYRTYAKDKATLDEYFEDPQVFFNNWKDDMPITDKTKIDIGAKEIDGHVINFGTMELQAVRSTLFDQAGSVARLDKQANDQTLIIQELRGKTKEAIQEIKEAKDRISTLEGSRTELEKEIKELKNANQSNEPLFTNSLSKFFYALAKKLE